MLKILLDEVKKFCRLIGKFIVSDEKFNLSFLLKNTVELFSITAVVAAARIIYLISEDSNEKDIANYVFWLFLVVLLFGLLQHLVVAYHSAVKTNLATKILIAFIVICYSFMMVTGVYAVTVIAKKYSDSAVISGKVDTVNKEVPLTDHHRSI